MTTSGATPTVSWISCRGCCEPMRSLDDLTCTASGCSCRVDFNVPLARGRGSCDSRRAGGVPLVSDDTRIAAALATIEELRARRREAGAGLASGPAGGQTRGGAVAGAGGRSPARADRREGDAGPGGGRRGGDGAGRGTAATATSWCSRTCASSRARRATIPSSHARWRRWRTSTSTTRSAWPTARTRAPRASRTCCRARPDGCSNAR